MGKVRKHMTGNGVGNILILRRLIVSYCWRKSSYHVYKARKNLCQIMELCKCAVFRRRGVGGGGGGWTVE